MKVLICGGRDFDDAEFVNRVLDSIHSGHRIEGIVHGGANGADRLAWMWGNRNGIISSVYKANWEEDGKAAGPIRNSKMLKETSPDLTIAFPGGIGTADMVKKSRAAEVPTIDFNDDIEDDDDAAF